MMTERDQQLIRILRIGHDTSMRGRGISLMDALNQASYPQLRPSFGPQDLLSYIQSNPFLVQVWLSYSEDKRTGGWYLLEDGSIGFGGNPRSKLRFNSMEEAVANYVVRELDYWVQP